MRTKLFVFFFCCSLFAVNIHAQDAALKEKFQKMNNEMIDAMMNENVDAIMGMYTDDVISMPSYEPMLKGKSAMIESHKKSHEAGFKMNDMSLNTMNVWSSGDYAYEIGTYNVNMTIPGMGDVDDNGKYLTVWQKQSDGSWKIKAETWNTDNNPWMDMEMDDMDMEGQ